VKIQLSTLNVRATNWLSWSLPCTDACAWQNVYSLTMVTWGVLVTSHPFLTRGVLDREDVRSQ